MIKRGGRGAEDPVAIHNFSDMTNELGPHGIGELAEHVIGDDCMRLAIQRAEHAARASDSRGPPDRFDDLGRTVGEVRIANKHAQDAIAGIGDGIDRSIDLLRARQQRLINPQTHALMVTAYARGNG